jgi:hypothetical protein
MLEDIGDIAFQALQSESEQPKSESRMYSEEEMRCSFDAGYDFRTSLNDDIIIEFGKDSAQTFESFIQSLKESRMYTEEEVCGFAEWFTTEDYIHRGMQDGEWFYRGVKHTKEELLRIYLNSLKPKTEESLQFLANQAQELNMGYEPKTEKVSPIVIEESPLENEWRKLKEQPYIPTEKEQSTSPSIENIAEERYPVMMINPLEGEEYKIDVNTSERLAFIQGFKANNSLVELENCVDDNTNGISVSLHDLRKKIKELKTKQ